MDFLCFLLLTAVLLIRPTDYFRAPVNLFLIVISVCLVLSMFSGALPRALSPRAWRRWPVFGCVVGLLAATVLSDLLSMRPDALLGAGVEFGKVVVFFVLLFGLVDSRRRLRWLLLATPLFISVTVFLSVLQYLGYIDNPAFRFVLATGEEFYGGLAEDRLIGPGTYKDPNDIAALINIAIMLCLYGFVSTRPRLLRAAWLIPLGLQLYALYLTKSRGGLLGTLTGVGVLLWVRFGSRKGVIAMAAALPLLLKFFVTRQVDLSSRADTGQLRIQLWFDALATWRRSPLWGVGSGCLPEYITRPPHNSFLNAYGELGFIGGTLFLGAFYLAFWRLYQLRPRSGALAVRSSRRLSPRRAPPTSGPLPGPPPALTPPNGGPGRILDPELARMQPFLLGALTSYALSIASTNHTYMVATYEVLGFAAAFIRIAESQSPVGVGNMVFNGRTAGRLILVSILFLFVMTAFVQLQVRW